MALCSVCELDNGRRVRCNICDRLVCELCIGTTAPDMGGPLCDDCDGSRRLTDKRRDELAKEGERSRARRKPSRADLKAASEKAKQKLLDALKDGKVVFGEHINLDFDRKKKTFPPNFTHISIEGWENKKSNTSGFLLRWGAAGWGGGEFTFIQHPDKRIEIQTECMGLDFLIAAIKRMLAEAEIRDI